MHPTGTFNLQSRYCGWTIAAIFRLQYISFNILMAEKHHPLSLHIYYFHQGRIQKCQVVSKATTPAVKNRHS